MPKLSYSAILNSRQSLRPIGSDDWIINCSRAVSDCKENGDVILTSVGMNCWEMALFLSAKLDANVQIVAPLPAGGDESEIISYYTKQFEIASDLVRWTFINSKPGTEGTHLFMKKRDNYILSRADKLLPISIRPNGTFDNYLNSLDKTSAQVSNNYLTGYKKSDSVGYDIKRQNINPEIDKSLFGCLIHWTRTSNTLWPDERLYDFYNSIVLSDDMYSHSALKTLLKIVGDKTFCSSARHMQKGVKAVSFSSLPPSKASKLMRYRARYREMSFEPYGLAIKANMADDLGVRPVIYGSIDQYRKLNDLDRKYFHSVGRTGNWPDENEYRLLSDLQFSGIVERDMILIVCHAHEIETARKYFDGEIISFYK